MAFIAALGSGLAAGVGILVALAIFALGRCLCSIASKDVQGRTIPKGERGQLNGISTTVAGIVAITLGLAIRAFVERNSQLLTCLVACRGCSALGGGSR